MPSRRRLLLGLALLISCWAWFQLFKNEQLLRFHFQHIDGIAVDYSERAGKVPTYELRIRGASGDVLIPTSPTEIDRCLHRPVYKSPLGRAIRCGESERTIDSPHAAIAVPFVFALIACLLAFVGASAGASGGGPILRRADARIGLVTLAIGSGLAVLGSILRSPPVVIAALLALPAAGITFTVPYFRSGARLAITVPQNTKFAPWIQRRLGSPTPWLGSALAAFLLMWVLPIVSTALDQRYESPLHGLVVACVGWAFLVLCFMVPRNQARETLDTHVWQTIVMAVICSVAVVGGLIHAVVSSLELVH